LGPLFPASPVPAMPACLSSTEVLVHASVSNMAGHADLLEFRVIPHFGMMVQMRLRGNRGSVGNPKKTPVFSSARAIFAMGITGEPKVP
jgi:hypothetical protein